MKKIIGLFFSFFLLGSLFAQYNDADLQLANEYFKSQEFDKAAALFEKVYNATNSEYFFEFYVKSLALSQQYDVAERAVKKNLRKNSKKIQYIALLGNLYKIQGKTQESTAKYDEAIQSLNGEKSQAYELGNEFINLQEYDYAEKTYLEAMKKNSDNDFTNELINLYTAQRNTSKLISIYIKQLLEDYTLLETVEMRLQYNLMNDIDNEFSKALKTTLIKKIQEMPNQIVLIQLLIWLYMQEKNFAAALIQEKALDKRTDSGGQRIIELGNLALENKDYTTSINAFKYLIEKGMSEPEYVNAQLAILDVYYKKIVWGISRSKQDFYDLEANYEKVIKTFQINWQSIPIMKNLAHLKAYYLNKPQEAIDVLNDAIITGRATPEQRAEIDLELGDIYLLLNKVWDATLIYAKVEKNFEGSPIGDDARLRKAKLAYYIGNFEWAKAQLDVLKNSTFKLVANDALELSAFITENMDIDTVGTDLKIFARSQLLSIQNRDSLAMLSMDSISSSNTNNELQPSVCMQKSKIMLKENQYEKAIEYLQKILNDYSTNIVADDACFTLAEIYQFTTNNKDKAKETYLILMEKYPASIHVVEARKRYRTLRGDNLGN